MAHILLAEDDNGLRHFLKTALERAGHRVTAVADGEAALAAATDCDLLIADIALPGIDGITLAQQAQAQRPQLRIMFITGFVAMSVKAQESLGWAAPVMLKPFHLRKLVEEVGALLAA